MGASYLKKQPTTERESMADLDIDGIRYVLRKFNTLLIIKKDHQNT